MGTEWIQAVDEKRKPISIKSREDIHRFGYWHETFHCWFVQRVHEDIMIYFQLRSKDKADYPLLLDITAAGHLLAGETINDGIREIDEELGLSLQLEDLTHFDIIQWCADYDGIMDREFAHVYIHDFKGSWNDFTLQKEEVDGMYRCSLTDFEQLYQRQVDAIVVEGFERDLYDDKQNKKKVSLEHFVPHDQDFYRHFFSYIRKHY